MGTWAAPLDLGATEPEAGADCAAEDPTLEMASADSRSKTLMVLSQFSGRDEGEWLESANNRRPESSTGSTQSPRSGFIANLLLAKSSSSWLCLCEAWLKALSSGNHKCFRFFSIGRPSSSASIR